MRKLIPRTSYRKKPWKNGQGFTEEIFLYPNEHFLFRLSMAALTNSGPFSSYPEIDRSLVIIEGPPVQINGRELLPFSPFSFSGEQMIHAGIEAPGRDFNLMCRRGEASGRILVGRNALELELGGKFFAIFSVGDVTRAGESDIKKYDTLVVDKSETGPLTVTGELFLVVEVNC